MNIKSFFKKIYNFLFVSETEELLHNETNLSNSDFDKLREKYRNSNKIAIVSTLNNYEIYVELENEKFGIIGFYNVEYSVLYYADDFFDYIEL